MANLHQTMQIWSTTTFELVEHTFSVQLKMIITKSLFCEDGKLNRIITNT